MPGRLTKEQQIRALERKDYVPKAREAAEAEGRPSASSRTLRDRDARMSELPVSRRGMNQESRDHNKHNNPGQGGHKPQKHSPAEEKR